MSVVVEATPFPIARQPLPKADPCVIVIFGALGDLTKRKLVPALFHLACAGSLSGRFKVLGIGRQPMNDEQFRAEMRKGATGAKEMGEFSDAEWQAFATRLHYLPGDVSEVETYLRIARHLEQMASEESASANHIFYLATPPSLALAIVNGLDAAGLASEQNGWSRIVFEKPFGRDLESARALNVMIARVFDEHRSIA